MPYDFSPFLTPTTFADHRCFLNKVLPSLNAAAVVQITDILYEVAVALRNDGQPQKSFKVGQVLHLVGRRLKTPKPMGIGNMLRGDARNSQRRFNTAWHYLMRARSQFDPIDDFSRARTVIGLLVAALSVNKVTEVTGEMFDQAERTFIANGDNSRLISLYRSRGILHRSQGRLTDLNTARTWYEQALLVAKTDEWRTLIILGDLASLAADHGNAREAKTYYERIYGHLQLDAFHQHKLMALQNLACSEKLLGHFRSALGRLDELLDAIDANNRENQEIYLVANLTKLECYLDLNRFEAVERLAASFLEEWPTPSSEELIALRFYWAQASIALGNFENAFNQIQMIFQTYPLDFDVALMNEGNTRAQMIQARLLLGHLALLQGNIIEAQSEARTALSFFVETHQAREEAIARLLIAKAQLMNGDNPQLVEDYSSQAAQIGLQLDDQLTLYRAYVLLGHARRAQYDLAGAQDWYEKAMAVIELSERELTVLLRPGFLGDKGEPLQALMTLHLDKLRPTIEQQSAAFTLLERSKSRIFLEYLVNNDALQSSNQPLTRKLELLRSDFLSFTNKANDETANQSVRKGARSKANRIKESMTETVHRLFNSTERKHYERFQETPNIADIQHSLDPDALLIEYYHDGQSLFVFAIERQSVSTYCLSATLEEIHSQSVLLEKRVNSKLAMLKSVPNKDVDPITILRHSYLNDQDDNQAFNQPAAALYNALLRPLEAHLAGHNQLIIVPYGQLHELPFHLLYKSDYRDGTNGRYLIEDYRVVILPTAVLLKRPPLQTTAHRIVLFDNWQSKLRHSIQDAECISEMLNSEMYNAQNIDWRVLLNRARGQILHIVAHGQFDGAHPELSFLQLGSEQLMMNDLLKLGLAFQLVTLTSCEAGKLKFIEYANAPSIGDDLIGLGRALLYTGSQSLLISRWHIGDGLTMPVVMPFYKAILSGQSKAQALRGAQLALYESNPTLHPVIWGVFQLIGDASPLY